MDDIKEVEPTTKNIHENIFEDLTIVINKIIDLTFEGLNKGENKNRNKQHILDYINNLKINLQEIYIWLLNNQNNSSSICLLGYFNFHGIVVKVNKKEAIELYQKATELENRVTQLELAHIYVREENTDNYKKAFELSKILAEEENPNALNRLGYCYEKGIGAIINIQRHLSCIKK
ncbi:hypothetical protein C1645_879017 [Glomus cerebriforme]|uniref:Uncharacterized protein n=1 Tax=Glomus cerebriforme TaxID=658196 RepID=A0A397SJT5_9GLOM|nr:hypothetical protein C1645_879017 [Glomus cerebriforme]